METRGKSVPPENPELGPEFDETVDAILDEASFAGGKSYGLNVSADGITLLLDCADPHGDLAATVARIENDFREMKLPTFPDSEILTEILEKACPPGESLHSFPIMKGFAATPCTHGRLEWERDFFTTETDGEDDDEAHDFWDQNDQMAVDKDELLVRVHLPVAGNIGLDVFCREIPASKPESVKLQWGKGVRQEDEGAWLAYYSVTAGRIRYQDETLLVDDVYVIKGDVSLETGNIRHTGTVHIEGDVKTGATIQADGDIMVKGMLEPCHVRCGGCLTVGGGIVGLEDYQVEVAGDIKAMYISAAEIQCEGDITVSNEIAHANIKTLGHVQVPTGRIAGGKVLAKAGIQTAEAGGSGSTATLLIVGVDYTVEKRIAQRKIRIEKLEEAQDKIQDALTKAGLEKESSTEPENSPLCELSGKMKLIGEAIIKEYAANKADQNQPKNACTEEVVMLREVWTGTTIQIGEAKMVIRASIEKPRIARLKKDKVRILPLGEGNKPEK